MVFKDRHATNELGLWCISALPSNPSSLHTCEQERQGAKALQQCDHDCSKSIVQAFIQRILKA